MNIMDIYDIHKKNILDGHFILLDYSIFFNEENLGRCTRFVIDDVAEIKQLKNIIEKLILNDENATVYICAYGKELMDSQGERFIYGNSIWIKACVEMEFLNHEFHNNSHLEPSKIEFLDDSEDRNQSPILYFENSGAVIDLAAHSNAQKLENILTLYWD